MFSHNLMILTENSTDKLRNFDSAIIHQLLKFIIAEILQFVH